MWLEIAKILGAPLLAGVVAAFLTNFWSARFAFGRFRQEQWWHEKRQAYDSIIRQLSKTLFEARRHLTEMESGGVAELPKAPDVTKAFSWSLQEVTSAGTYIVTQKTVDAVDQFLATVSMSQARHPNDFHGMVEEDYDAAKQAIELVRTEAHRDLGVTKYPFLEELESLLARMQKIANNGRT